MKLRINGEYVDIPDTVTNVLQLLGHFGLENKVVVVELNGNILARSDHADSGVRDGDRVEIVNFVGGG